MTSITIMRTDRFRAKSYLERRRVRPTGSPDGTPGVEIPAGHWAVHDGRTTFAMGPDAFSSRFVRLGDHWAERSRRIQVEFEDGVFSIAGIEIASGEILDKCAWCDDDGDLLAFGSDPLDVVLAAAVAKGTKASGVIEVLGFIRSMSATTPCSDEMRRFDEIWAGEPVPRDETMGAWIRRFLAEDSREIGRDDLDRAGMGLLRST